MGGLDALLAVQSRIAQIEARVSSLAGRPASGALGTGRADFATALASAQTAPSAATWTGPTDAAPVEIRDLAAKHPQMTQWSLDLLERLGMPKTRENVRLFVAWQLAEGTEAQFNPLAVNRDHPGATDFNSVGVKNYPSYEAGLQETVEGLHNGNYDHILAALAAGNDARAVATAIQNSRWGTGGLVLKVLESGMD
jgi:hypothetical protein